LRCEASLRTEDRAKDHAAAAAQDAPDAGWRRSAKTENKRLPEHFNIPVAFHEADAELFDSYDKQPLRSYGLVGKVVLGMSLKVLRNTAVPKPVNCITVREGDSLIAGDALDNWITPATGHLYSNKDDIKKSAGRIRDLGPRTIYYGHGKPTKNRSKRKAT